MATGVGADVDILSVGDGLVITVEHVAERLKEGSYDVLTMVQVETSSGVCTMEFPAFAQLCKQHGALVVVDAGCFADYLFGCCLGTDRKASRAQAALVFGRPARQ